MSKLYCCDCNKFVSKEEAENNPHHFLRDEQFYSKYMKTLRSFLERKDNKVPIYSNINEWLSMQIDQATKILQYPNIVEEYLTEIKQVQNDLKEFDVKHGSELIDRIEEVKNALEGKKTILISELLNLEPSSIQLFQKIIEQEKLYKDFKKKYYSTIKDKYALLPIIMEMTSISQNLIKIIDDWKTNKDIINKSNLLLENLMNDCIKNKDLVFSLRNSVTKARKTYSKISKKILKELSENLNGKWLTEIPKDCKLIPNDRGAPTYFVNLREHKCVNYTKSFSDKIQNYFLNL